MIPVYPAVYFFTPLGSVAPLLTFFAGVMIIAAVCLSLLFSSIHYDAFEMYLLDEKCLRIIHALEAENPGCFKDIRTRLQNRVSLIKILK